MKLRTLRESAGLTQRGLARLARISRSSVSHVETGRYPPTAAFAGKVCRALSEELGVRIQTWDVFPAGLRRSADRVVTRFRAATALAIIAY